MAETFTLDLFVVRLGVEGMVVSLAHRIEA